MAKRSASLAHARRIVRKGLAITESKIDYSDIPQTDEKFWADAAVLMPGPKIHLSVRLDKDVVGWFKRQGPGYQTRMNAVLRSYVQAVSKVRERR